jgi:hypothetical protein
VCKKYKNAQFLCKVHQLSCLLLLYLARVRQQSSGIVVSHDLFMSSGNCMTRSPALIYGRRVKFMGEGPAKVRGPGVGVKIHFYCSFVDKGPVKLVAFYGDLKVLLCIEDSVVYWL